MNAYTFKVVTCILEALISGLFVYNQLQHKYKKIVSISFWIAIDFVAMIFLPIFSFGYMYVVAIAELILLAFLFDDKVTRKLAVFLVKELIIITSSLIAVAINSLIIVEDGFGPAVSGNNRYVYKLLYLILFSVLASTVFQFEKEVRGVEFSWVVGTKAVIGLGEIFAVVAFADLSEGSMSTENSFFLISAVICMVVANISIGMLAPYLLHKVSVSSDTKHEEELSSMEYKYYEMSVKNDRELLAIKHDISNHIQTIYSLIVNGENESSLVFLNELKTRYSNINQRIYCDNPVVNIILANKKKEAEEKGIETHIKVKRDIGNVPITDFDFSTIICNLLDNAIQGCQSSGQPNPRMVVEILEKNRYLVVRVLNSCKVSMNVESTDRLDSTKTVSKSHGIGMSIILGIAKKYGGDFIVSAQNGIFTSTVVMSLKS